MYIYWKIMEELMFLGEILHIRDPSILRELKRWLKRHNFRYLEGKQIMKEF